MLLLLEPHNNRQVYQLIVSIASHLYHQVVHLSSQNRLHHLITNLQTLQLLFPKPKLKIIHLMSRKVSHLTQHRIHLLHQGEQAPHSSQQALLHLCHRIKPQEVGICHSSSRIHRLTQVKTSHSCHNIRVNSRWATVVT